MSLNNYLKKIELPNKALQANNEVSKSFLENHILNFWDAIEYVHELPYGRTKDRENYLQVLDEKKGACSTKHALISALAKEQFVPLKLTLGIFLLTAENMPKISHLLASYDLPSIPEAHCYLKYNHSTLDITFPNNLDFSVQTKLEMEMSITPQQIGFFKVQKHQEFIKEWIKDKPHLNFELIWKAREQWILELTQN